MKYNGMIIQESLEDANILTGFVVDRIKETNDENEDDRRHIYHVLAEDTQILDLERYIKFGPWYSHFWNNEEIIIVFRDKVFRFNKDDKEGIIEAEKYGTNLGIPQEQLDFLIVNE